MIIFKPTNQYILSILRSPSNYQVWLPKAAYYALYGNWTHIMRLTVTKASILYPKISSCFKIIMSPVMQTITLSITIRVSIKPKGKGTVRSQTIMVS